MANGQTIGKLALAAATRLPSRARRTVHWASGPRRTKIVDNPGGHAILQDHRTARAAIWTELHFTIFGGLAGTTIKVSGFWRIAS
jgi:hypothetical protein